MLNFVEKLKIVEKNIPFKVFIESRFNYCPLVWMFHGRQINGKINKLNERAIRAVHIDIVKSLENLNLKVNLLRLIMKMFY